MVPRPEGVTITSRTSAWTGFNVAGPKSRELLQRMTNEDMSNDAWKFMHSRAMTVAGIDVTGLRVSFTGDLGWELYSRQEDQLALYDALFEAGEDLGIRPVGGRALMSLRLEKGYGSWGREYSPEYWPQEVGLERLIKLDKPEFLGREAYLQLKDKPAREKLVMLEIDADNADASGGEPVFLTDGTPVGRISSGSYGFWVEKSLALAFVRADAIAPGQTYHAAVLGKPHTARILDQPPFDPDGARLRG